MLSFKKGHKELPLHNQNASSHQARSCPINWMSSNALIGDNACSALALVIDK